MDEQAGHTNDPPTWGCMECHANQPSAVEHFPNGNTGWRCRNCSHILRLILGKDISTDTAVEAPA